MTTTDEARKLANWNEEQGKRARNMGVNYKVAPDSVYFKRAEKHQQTANALRSLVEQVDELKGDLASHDWGQDRLVSAEQRAEAAEKKLEAALAVVDEQINDQALWAHCKFISEAYMQQELRRLHEAVEGITSEEHARRTLAALDAHTPTDTGG